MLKLAAVVLLFPGTFASGWFLSRHQDPAKPEQSLEERKEELVREYLKVTHARKTMEDSIDAMLDTFKNMPMLPEGFGERFKELFDLEHLEELTIPVLMEHLEVSTLEGAIAFYKTEAGEALALAQGPIASECAKIGQEYGSEIGMQVGRELSKR